MAIPRYASIFLKFMIGWLVVSTSLIVTLNWGNVVHRAVMLMGAGLVVFWVLGFGFVSLRYGPAISAWVKQLPMRWGVKFVLFCTVLAMLEEVVTTTMTNLAPAMGVQIGQAYITASANYFDVILFHSVCIFVSLFVGWAVMLSRWAFSANEAFLLFGITGLLAEMGFSGRTSPAEFALWIPVYGLMVYLPTLALPERPKAKRPKWWMYPLAVYIPYLFIVLFPLAGILHILFSPNHAKIDFPPIR